MPKDAPEVTVCVVDDIPPDVPHGYGAIYLEGLKAGRLGQSKGKFQAEINLLQRRIKLPSDAPLAKFMIQSKINELVIERDVFLQGYRNGERHRNDLKGGVR